MRLLITTTRLYRAFPELDRFDDESCSRFVSAACRAGWFTMLRWILVGATWLAGSVALLFGVAWAWMNLKPDHVAWYVHERWITVILVALIFGCLTAGACGALIVRDMLLRRRIGRLIRDRARCVACRYVLLGLPVDKSGLITCPECGTSLRSDPALDELGPGDDGRPRLRSTIPWRAPWHVRVFTRRRLAIAAKVVVVLALFGAIAGAVAWVIERERFEAEIARAKALMPMGDAMNRLTLAGLPEPPEPGAPDPWPIFDKVIAEYASAEATVTAALAPTTLYIGPDYQRIYRIQSDFPEDSEEEKRYREEAIAMLAALDKTSAFPLLTQVAACPAKPREFSATGPLINLPLPELSYARRFGRINAARMDRAALREDFTELRDAIRQTVGMRGMYDYSGLLVDRLVGMATETLVIETGVRLMLERPSQGLIDALQAGFEEKEAEPSLSTIVQAERLLSLNAICWVFSQPDRGARRRTFESAVGTRSGAAADRRLGSLSENVEALEATFERLDRIVTLPLRERPEPSLESGDLGLVDPAGLEAAIARGRETAEILRLRRQGLLTMIALERARLRDGEYPESLDALVPGLLRAIPIDPWSGGPVVYRRIDSATDDFQRGYLLYSVGADGRDDGGHVASRRRMDVRTRRESARSSAPRGSDFVINEPDDWILRPMGTLPGIPVRESAE